jgi:Zn-dependent protease
MLRDNIPTGAELKELALADIVLSVAFTLVLLGGIGTAIQFPDALLYFFPIALIAITLTFVLHEMMHKFVAQRYGAIAAFKASRIGLIITLIPSMLGFLIGLPGATIIYSNRFTQEEEGIVSLAGPLTNFAVFFVFLAVGMIEYPHFLSQVLLSFTGGANLSYFQNMINITLFISLILAFFNMLPIYPLDGSKVLKWSKPAYLATLASIFVLLILIVPIFSLIESFVVMFVFAAIISTMSRVVLF